MYDKLDLHILQTNLADLPLDTLKVFPNPAVSPETVTSPTTIESVDHAELAEQWAKHTEESVLQCSDNKPVDYKVKAEEELASIQRKARRLELMMLNYQAEHGAPKDSPMSPMHESSCVGEALTTDIVLVQDDCRPEAQTMARLRSKSDITNNAITTSVQSSSQRNLRPQLHPRRTKSSGVLGADTQVVPRRPQDGEYLNP